MILKYNIHVIILRGGLISNMFLLILVSAIHE